MSQTRLILVGGFLGAGKTTLLAQATYRLSKRGLKVGLVTNDQAEDLVDTEFLEEKGMSVQEVSGGCFCCRFGCLLSASDLLVEESESDILLAEPVGSCTDISATVLQPLKQFYARRFSVAPFSVLADPIRLTQSLGQGARADDPLPKEVSYILRKQLEEADLIVLNKADLLGRDQIADIRRLLEAEFPHAPIFEMSALTGEGVDDWLDAVMGEAPGGTRIASVDYDIYASGEARLGWLNGSVRLRGDEKDWPDFACRLLRSMQERLRRPSAEIAHVKLVMATAGGSIFANVTSSEAEPSVRGSLTGSPDDVLLTLNARVATDPVRLREVVTECLESCCGDEIRSEVIEMQSFSPGRPQPVHRFAELAGSGEVIPKGRLKTVVTAVLLAFVALSLGVFVVGEIRSAGGGKATPTGRAGLLANGVTVCLFHPVESCPSCKRIKKWTTETIQSAFGEDLKSGRLAVRSFAYNDPANRSFAAEYEVFTTSVVVIQSRDGRTQRWKYLDGVMMLQSAEREEEFRQYIRDEVAPFLEGR